MRRCRSISHREERFAWAPPIRHGGLEWLLFRRTSVPTATLSSSTSPSWRSFRIYSLRFALHHARRWSSDTLSPRMSDVYARHFCSFNIQTQGNLVKLEESEMSKVPKHRSVSASFWNNITPHQVLHRQLWAKKGTGLSVSRLTLWHPLLPHGCSHKAFYSCARPR